ncbi:hypothetical protein [Rhodococcus sp. NPDC127528]|uniref:hypothetical protein n=1 Tax=unclassified Rhodococcus (in: high G+C Gram-positive bacteria) TaxID=192944 RepID=UPI00363575B7
MTSSEPVPPATAVTVDLVAKEIERHHDVLARWLGTAADPAVLTEFTGAHTADFALVTTDGRVLGNDELTESLRGAARAVPGLRISITAVEVRQSTAAVVVVRFRETHHTVDETSVRIVTAVLVPDAAGRNGLRWNSVHETACDQAILHTDGPAH